MSSSFPHSNSLLELSRSRKFAIAFLRRCECTMPFNSSGELKKHQRTCDRIPKDYTDVIERARLAQQPEGSPVTLPMSEDRIPLPMSAATAAEDEDFIEIGGGGGSSPPYRSSSRGSGDGDNSSPCRSTSRGSGDDGSPPYRSSSETPSPPHKSECESEPTDRIKVEDDRGSGADRAANVTPCEPRERLPNVRGYETRPTCGDTNPKVGVPNASDTLPAGVNNTDAELAFSSRAVAKSELPSRSNTAPSALFGDATLPPDATSAANASIDYINEALSANLTTVAPNLNKAVTPSSCDTSTGSLHLAQHTINSPTSVIPQVALPQSSGPMSPSLEGCVKPEHSVSQRFPADTPVSSSLVTTMSKMGIEHSPATLQGQGIRREFALAPRILTPKHEPRVISDPHNTPVVGEIFDMDRHNACDRSINYLSQSVSSRSPPLSSNMRQIEVHQRRERLEQDQTPQLVENYRAQLRRQHQALLQQSSSDGLHHQDLHHRSRRQRPTASTLSPFVQSQLSSSLVTQSVPRQQHGELDHRSAHTSSVRRRRSLVAAAVVPSGAAAGLEGIAAAVTSPRGGSCSTAVSSADAAVLGTASSVSSRGGAAADVAGVHADALPKAEVMLSPTVSGYGVDAAAGYNDTRHVFGSSAAADSVALTGYDGATSVARDSPVHHRQHGLRYFPSSVALAHRVTSDPQIQPGRQSLSSTSSMALSREQPGSPLVVPTATPTSTPQYLDTRDSQGEPQTPEQLLKRYLEEHTARPQRGNRAQLSVGTANSDRADNSQAQDDYDEDERLFVRRLRQLVASQSFRASTREGSSSASHARLPTNHPQMTSQNMVAQEPPGMTSEAQTTSHIVSQPRLSLPPTSGTYVSNSSNSLQPRLANEISPSSVSIMSPAPFTAANSLTIQPSHIHSSRRSSLTPHFRRENFASASPSSASHIQNNVEQPSSSSISQSFPRANHPTMERPNAFAIATHPTQVGSHFDRVGHHTSHSLLQNDRATLSASHAASLDTSSVPRLRREEVMATLYSGSSHFQHPAPHEDGVRQFVSRRPSDTSAVAFLSREGAIASQQPQQQQHQPHVQAANLSSGINSSPLVNEDLHIGKLPESKSMWQDAFADPLMRL